MTEAAASQPPAEGQQAAGFSRGADLTTLVEQHHAPVYRYAVRLCGCPAEAEDLTQQAFLIAQRKRHQLRDPSKARSWLLSIVRSCFLKSLSRPRPVRAEDVAVCLTEWAAPPPPEEIDREQLAAALAALPPEFRVVVLMFYFEELSYQEIAEQLGIPIGTVMSRLSRAKSHLRRWLAEPTPPPVALPQEAPRSTAPATPCPART